MKRRGLGEDTVARIQGIWRALSALPGGKRAFSLLLGRAAPYTGSIGARVLDLGSGSARVVLPDRRRVRNHLDSVHAIALANLGELAANLALSSNLPPNSRFIITGLQIEYLRKARGAITAEGTSPPIPSNERAAYQALATMRDAAGEVVARCTVDALVGPSR